MVVSDPDPRPDADWERSVFGDADLGVGFLTPFRCPCALDSAISPTYSFLTSSTSFSSFMVDGCYSEDDILSVPRPSAPCLLTPPSKNHRIPLASFVALSASLTSGGRSDEMELSPAAQLVRLVGRISDAGSFAWLLPVSRAQNHRVSTPRHTRGDS